MVYNKLMGNLDFGFNLEYPRTHGLFERFDESSSRIIVQAGKVQDLQLPATSDELTFPVDIEKARIIHRIPNDSRSLAYTIRLIKNPENTYDIGKLLGIKLAQTDGVFGGVPEDEVLTRYASYSSDNLEAQKFGGINIRLLPPFTELNGKIGDARNIITEDCIKIGGRAIDNLDFFLNAVEIGRSSVRL